MDSSFRLRVFATLAFAGLLSGCAVLTVDVDVYKGPLANHEHVLTEQTAVMAIGAKPLLEHLCNELKGGSENTIQPNGGCENTTRTNQGSENTINQAQAMRVEAVLELYDDLFGNSPRLREYADRADRHLEASQTAITLVAQKIVAQKNKDLQVWEAVKKGVKGEFHGCLQNTGEPKTKHCRFIDAVKTFFVPKDDSFRRARHLVDSYLRYTRNAVTKENKTFLPDDGPTTAAYAFLAQNATALSGTLFQDNEASDLAQKFVVRLTEIADSFAAARHAMMDLWVDSLKFMNFVNDPKADMQKGNSKARARMTLALATLIAELTDVKDLAVAIYLSEKGGSKESESISRLREILNSRSSPDEGLWAICYKKPRDNCDPRTDWGKNRKSRARAALDSAIVAKPRKMVYLLLEVDDFFRNIENDNCNEGTMGTACRAARKYGVVSVPNPGLLEELLSDFKAVKRAGGVGLERGRLSQGLDTLIEEYLRAAAGRDDNETMEERKKLLDALVRFAEKVLVIANHEQLLNPKGAAGKNTSPDGLDKYVLTLQAIGNAIIVQVDELVRRRKHQERLVTSGRAELQALQQAFNPSAFTVINAVREELSAKLVTAKDALAAKQAKGDEAGEEVVTTRKDLETATEETARLRDVKQKAEDGLSAAIVTGAPAIHAWQTFSGDSPEILKQIDSRFEENKTVLEKDAAAVSKRIQSAENADNTVAALLTEIESWIDNETQESGNSPARYSRLTSTKSLLRKDAAELKKAGAKATRAETLKEIKNYIASQYHTALNDISVRWKQVQQSRQDVEAARTRTVAIENKRGVAEKAVESLKTEVKELEDRNNVLGDAIRVVELAVDDTLRSVMKKKTLAGPAAVFRLFRAKVAEKAAAEGATDDTLKVFDELTVPLELFSGVQVARGEKEEVNQLDDVLDKMIAHLRYALIHAESNGRTDQAEQIRRAIKAALAQRAGMAYIRPSSTFLRSSYAGTGLQSDPGLTWRNMLERHANRTLPLLGANWKHNDRKARNSVIAEIDKQFWQNINKVRVAGGGNTNYVLAKDDIGNWYVKSYQTDREDIFKSARNLALFGVGAKLDLNLLERMKLEEEFQEEGSMNCVRNRRGLGRPRRSVMCTGNSSCSTLPRRRPPTRN